MDILRPAAIAVAALCRAVRSNSIDPDDTVLLNITGGGLSRLKEDYAPNQLSADLLATDENMDELMEVLLL